MNTKIVGFIAFLLGAAVGSVATWQLIKNKYEQFADEEIEAVKEMADRRIKRAEERSSIEVGEKVLSGLNDAFEKSLNDVKEVAAQARVKSSITSIHVNAGKKPPVNYSDFSSTKKPLAEDEEEEENEAEQEERLKQLHKSVVRPFVISPDDYSEMGNDKLTLMYFADGVIAYEDGEIPEDIYGKIGTEFVKHFGEYEEDAVYVRNNQIGADYEILKDPRKFSNAFPHNVKT